MNEQSNVKKVIGVVSGKGGVGKSSVTSMLAVATQRMGYKVAILDADITGPSIPQAFGIKDKATGTDEMIFPVESKTGITVMSVNALLEDTTDPVVWRGPVLSGVIEQFWNNVVWGDIDVMFGDMPPGTGDIQISISQRLKLDGAVIVSTPQDIALIDAVKGVNMFKKVEVPILGIVENMSYYICPKCGKATRVGTKVTADGKKVRVCKKCSAEF